ncbi:MAG TPA: hypothetical protein V6D22_23040 [Candidatus Obscuribacterales bacterium]
MKLSALLAVSLPLLSMSQAPASAEPSAMAQTGSWLKQSITSLKTTSHSAPAFKVAAKPAPRKVSHAMPAGSTGYQPASLGAQLRPFMPNRPLPHESDLQRAALVSQQAQVDNSIAMMTPRSLSGEVNYQAPQMVSSYSQYGMSVAETPMPHQMKAKRQIGGRSPRLMPGQAPMVPSQLTANQAAVQPMIPDPPVQQAAANRPQFPVSMPVAMMSQTQSAQMPMQGYGNSGLPPAATMQGAQWQQQMPMQGMMPQQMPMQQMQQMPMQQMPMQGMMPMQQMPTQQMQWPQQMPMQGMMTQQMPMQNMQWQQQQMPMQGYAPGGLPAAGTIQRNFMQSMQPMVSPAFEAPRLTQQEQLALEKLAAQNRPAAVMDFNGDVHGIAKDNPSNGTGPGPRPMNLLPGNAMQRLSLARKPANVPQARFGSWHGAALPECGFHSWLGNRQPHLFSYKVTPPTGRQTPTARRGAVGASRSGSLAMSRANSGHTHAAALSHAGAHGYAASHASRTAMSAPQSVGCQPKAKPLVVASYPMYTSSRGVTY